jgi:hypothetical protein
MPDWIIMENDQAIFIPVFGAAVVVVQPGIMKATGKTTITGKKICLVGDEKDVSVPGCMYITSIHSIPGTGPWKIDALAGDQQSQKTSSGGKKIIVKGSTFTAKFEVQVAAKDPSTIPSMGKPTDDTTTSYSGSGNFVTTNMKFKIS